MYRFLTEDGEKAWRNRNEEFKNPPSSKAELVAYWNSGWDYLFEALYQLNSSNFDTTITIRKEDHSIYGRASSPAGPSCILRRANGAC